MKNMVDVTKAMESGYMNVDLVRDSPTKKMCHTSRGRICEAEYIGKNIRETTIKRRDGWEKENFGIQTETA
jgi:hypothetical protein